jgi:3',5'-cyclic-AMP phosphodiesterase
MTDQHSSSLSRRSWLGLTASALTTSGFAENIRPEAGDFRFAFLTDIHVQPEKGAADGLRQCLQRVNALESKPGFVITGGDLIMDSLDVDHERLKLQWKIFDECWKTLEMPAHHTIGNHDVGGWSAKSIILPGENDYGKKLFAERYGAGRTYRSFDHGGWHFITLDSIGQNPETRDYLGWVDEEQQEWLKADLERAGKTTPVILVTHIPFYSVWGQMNGDPRHGESPKGLVNNAHVLRKLLAPHNVKLVLSGHGHVLERIQFGNTTYIQGGAVSGMWWKGPVFGNPEGFGLVTCRADGTFDFDYQGYGWKVVK